MLKSIFIEGFRAFKNVDVPQLGRVNLVVGRNNVGKTTLLEAMHIYTSSNPFQAVEQLLERRQEFLLEDETTLYNFGALFHHHEIGLPISIGPVGADSSATLKLSAKWQWSHENENAPQRHEIGDSPPDDVQADRILISERGEFLSIFQVEKRRRLRLRRRDHESSFGSMLLPLAGFQANNVDISELWDRVVLTDREESVLQALQSIEPKLRRIVMVQGKLPDRIAIAKIEGHDAMPLRSLGDGMSRLFEVAVGLVNVASGGAFLVDELDSGLHFTTLVNIWRLLFVTADTLDIQVMATTHSWDCIEAFQIAAAEHEAEGILIRLQNLDAGIHAECFSEKQLAIATRESIEVR